MAKIPARSKHMKVRLETAFAFDRDTFEINSRTKTPDSLKQSCPQRSDVLEGLETEDTRTVEWRADLNLDGWRSPQSIGAVNMQSASGISIKNNTANLFSAQKMNQAANALVWTLLAISP